MDRLPPSGPRCPCRLVVRAVDSQNNPVPGSEVSFVPADGSTAEPRMSATDSSGEVSASWKLGPRAGAQALTASIEATNKPAATFSAHALSGPPEKLSGSSGPAVGASGDVRHVLAVSVTDANGNPTPKVTIRWSLETSGGSLSSDTSLSDESGIARVVLSTGKESRRQRVAARTSDLATVIEVAAK